MIGRIILYVLVFFSILNGWWFIALPLLLIGVWLYAFRIEIIVAGIAYDALFGMIPGTGLWGYIGTIVAGILLLGLFLLKKLVR